MPVRLIIQIQNVKIQRMMCVSLKPCTTHLRVLF